MENIPDTFSSVRFRPIKDIEDYKSTIKHNTRAIEDKRITNDSGIQYIDEEGNIQIIKGVGTDWSFQQLDTLTVEYTTHIREHKKLNKQYRKNRHTTLVEGVLYFSKGINEDYEKDIEGFNQRVKNYIRDFEKINDTKVISNVIHTDEAGNIHIHFIFKNFNSLGKSLRTTQKHKERGKHQDLPPKHFNDFGRGYYRGIENSERKNLPIEEYKKMKEDQKQLELLKKEHKQLKEDNKKLLEDQEELKSNIEGYKFQIEDIELNFQNIRESTLDAFQNIINDLELFQEVKDWKQKLLLIKRYIKNGRDNRIDKTIEKIEYEMNKLKKPTQKSSNRSKKPSKSI